MDELHKVILKEVEILEGGQSDYGLPESLVLILINLAIPTHCFIYDELKPEDHTTALLQGSSTKTELLRLPAARGIIIRWNVQW